MESRKVEEYRREGKEIIRMLKKLEAFDMWIPNGTSPCEMFKVTINGRTAAKGTTIVNYHIDMVY